MRAVPWWGVISSAAGAAAGMLVAANPILRAGQVGLAERVVGAAQAAWPLAVVLSCYRPVRAPVRVPDVNRTSTA